ncbi:MAG TPA: hypothetical protein VFF73_38335 [Planctomycetota bacterium]|nr:hypothetical protein [Planctomycetota bacterium]
MRRRGVAVFEVVLHLTIASIVGSLVVVARHPAWKKNAIHHDGNCTKNAGLAALSCPDDKRFFPRMAAPSMRTLVFYGPCDDPEPFVRPSSPDDGKRLEPGVKGD